LDLTTVAVAGSKQGYLIHGLNPGTTYFFAIRTQDAAANLAPWFGSPLSSAPAQDLPPNAPTPVSIVNVGETALQLNWTGSVPPAFVNDIPSYTIYRATFSFASSTETNVNVAAILAYPTTTYLDTGLTAGVSYFYRLTAIDSGTVTSGL